MATCPMSLCSTHAKRCSNSCTYCPPKDLSEIAKGFRALSKITLELEDIRKQIENISGEVQFISQMS